MLGKLFDKAQHLRRSFTFDGQALRTITRLDCVTPLLIELGGILVDRDCDNFEQLLLLEDLEVAAL